ncbi:Sec-independent protein translocase subunit TatA [Streptomyces sp. NPDC102274]|uniref:Sec-independent protein translocase subunit TatA n=1 Tax=Streptomyces sp. NPDC102274 TaxID=3366151 RepID=UPI0038146A1F
MLRNGLEPWHLLIVAIVIIVLFGSKKLPDAARAVGKSMRILRSEAKAMKEEGLGEGLGLGGGQGAEHPAPSAQAPVAAARAVAPEGADAAR